MGLCLQGLKNVLRDAVETALTVYKVVIPVMVVIKILQEIGGISFLAKLFEPACSLLGLPGSMGLVIASGAFINLYAAMVAYIPLSAQDPLTVAQITVLSSYILLAHNLLVETQIARMSGVRVGWTLLLRLGGGLVYCSVLRWALAFFPEFSMISQPAWQPPAVDASTLGWLFGEAKKLAMIFAIITAAMAALRLFRHLGILKRFEDILHPMIRWSGITRPAISALVVGFFIGLSYGGALILKDIRDGRVRGNDVFLVHVFLAGAHALVEDTLLMILLGAKMVGIFWGRLLWTAVIVWIASLLYRKVSVKLRHRFFARVSSAP